MQKPDKDTIDLDSVYREYASLVYRFLYAHTHDAHWSEELMQETFLRVVTSIERYDGSCKLSVWICQIAKHVWYQELHKKKRTETVERTEGMEACTVSDGEADVLRPGEQPGTIRSDSSFGGAGAEVVLYRMTGELSFREIGEIMGRSENWCRTIFYRAKQKIKKELSAYE